MTENDVSNTKDKNKPNTELRSQEANLSTAQKLETELVMLSEYKKTLEKTYDKKQKISNDKQ